MRRGQASLGQPPAQPPPIPLGAARSSARVPSPAERRRDDERFRQMSAAQDQMEEDAAWMRSYLRQRKRERQQEQELMAQRLARAVLAPEHWRTKLLGRAVSQWRVATRLEQADTAEQREEDARQLATRVQAAWRGRQQRRRLGLVLRAELTLLQAECAASGVEDAAAVAIQSWWRGHASRARFKLELAAMLQQLQAELRLINSVVGPRHAAATRIQARHRGNRQRRGVQERRVAAVAIQRYWRGCMARSRCGHLRREAEETAAMLRAVTVTQSCQRGRRARCSLTRRHRAATRVQACWRGRRSRMAQAVLSARRTEALALRRERAAVGIQRIWCGCRTRRRLRAGMGASVLLQSLCRAALVQWALARELYELSAVRMCVSPSPRANRQQSTDVSSCVAHRSSL